MALRLPALSSLRCFDALNDVILWAPWPVPYVLPAALLKQGNTAPHLLLTFMPGGLQHYHSAHTVVTHTALELCCSASKITPRRSDSTLDRHADARRR